MRGSWTAANELVDGYRFKETEILRECSVPIRLLAHRFLAFQIMPSARFAFGRWRVDIEV